MVPPILHVVYAQSTGAGLTKWTSSGIDSAESGTHSGLVRMATLASRDRPILALQTTCRYRTTTVVLGRVDELFDANPRGHQMNECEKGLAQFLIPRGNASKLFEFVKEPFHLLP